MQTSNKKPANAVEVKVPFFVVSQRYPEQVAAIVHKIRTSSGTTVKITDKQPASFEWFYEYSQPADPKTRDLEEFEQIIRDTLRVSLVARGFRWRMAVQIPDIPENVWSRMHERATLICRPAPDETAKGKAVDETDTTWQDKVQKAKALLLDAVKQSPEHGAVITCAITLLDQLSGK